jgi:drug/metabolite transporter (DMT)-like permease
MSVTACSCTAVAPSSSTDVAVLVKRRAGDLALVVAAVCFGSTFLVVQGAIERVEPIPFLAARFLVAAAVLWPLARSRPSSAGELRDGILAGGALVVGYVLQTVGLQYTGSATSAFITYLLVVFVPLLALLILRRRPHPVTLAGVVVAVIGLVLLTDPGGAGQTGGFGRGEVLTLGCAVAFAAHVVILGETAHRHDPIRLAAVQVTVVGALCAVPGLWLGGYRFPMPAVAAAIATALVATALAFGLQVFGQRSVPPARAALLLLLEPVFAGIVASIRGESLRAVQLGGAALILVAVLLAETLPDVLQHRLDRRVNSREAGLDNDRSQPVPVTD